MFWRNNILILCLIIVSGANALAQTEYDQDRDSFYRRQVMRDLNPNQKRYPRIKKDKSEEQQQPVYSLDVPANQQLESMQQSGTNQEMESNQSAVAPKARVKFKEPQKIFASPAQRESYKLNQEKLDTNDWGIGLDLASGYSSNVARFEGAPSGSFTDISPKIFWGGRLIPQLEFDLSADLFYRTFHDSEIDDIFRTSIINASGSTSLYLTKSFFIGLSGKTTHFDGREIDFTTPNTNGRDSQLSVNSFEFSVGREWETSFIEFAVGQEYVRGRTTVLDEEGNQFFPDLNQSQAGFRVGREFTNNFRWDAQYELRHRLYQDQRARLENGRVDPNFDTAPKHEELEHGFQTTLVLWDFLLEGGADITRDLVNGGMSRKSFFGNIILPIEMWNTMLLRPEAGVRYTEYDSFVGQIFRDLNATQLREERWSFYGAELIVDLGMIDPVLAYRRTALKSTFNIIDFEEDFVSVGIQAAF